jgi:F-type H+-transporting ATPase subunit b
MRVRIATFLQLVFLAILIGAVPVAFASSVDGSNGVARNEITAGANAGALLASSQAKAPSVSSHEAPATGHAAAAKSDGHGGALAKSLAPAKLKDLFWRTVNFLALVVLLVKFLAKPIGAGLSGRQQQIKEELDDLSIRRDEAEKSYKEFEAKLAGMEKEMEMIVQKAIAQAQNEKERILAEAERAAEDIKRQAEAAVQAELEDAKRLLRAEVAEQAAAMAEELIIRNLTPADQVAITEQYLERVGAVQ